jgi:hypothetical protein
MYICLMGISVEIHGMNLEERTVTKLTILGGSWLDPDHALRCHQAWLAGSSSIEFHEFRWLKPAFTGNFLLPCDRMVTVV